MKTIKSILIYLIIFAMYGCEDYLKEDPPTFVSFTNFFITETDARNATDGIYKAINDGGAFSLYGRFWPAIDLGTDDMTARKQNATFISWFNHTINGNHPWFIQWNQWSNWWTAIYRANVVIERVPVVEMDAARRDAMVAEAYILRAFCYFQLVRTWGDVPIITTEVTSLGDISGLPREDVDKIYDEVIIPDLQKAEDMGADDLHFGHATKWTAKLVLADVYLNRAGWRRTSAGQMAQGDQSNWQLARDKALEVIQDSPNQLNTDPVINGFDTVPAYGVAWQQPYTKESMFELAAIPEAEFGSWLSREAIIRRDGLDFWGNPLTAKPFEAEGNNLTIAQMRFPTALPMVGFYCPTPDLYRAFEDGDTRKSWGMLTRYIAPDGSTYLINPVFRKFADIAYFMNEPNTDFRNTNTNYVLYRYADALLIYAEAANEAENGPSQMAYDMVNMIRARAGLHDLAPALSQSEFREAVWNERRCELHAEHKRRFDLIRTNRLTSETEDVDVTWRPEDNPPYLPAPFVYGHEVTAWPEHEWLLPLPSSELSFNESWQNNAGY